MTKNHFPWIIAHRGARDESPENSYTALKQALAYAVDGVEYDVQMSSDGVPILYHDRTLRKVGGGRKRISNLNRTDLERIDWGKWFHSRFSGEPLPTLAKALSLLNRCPNMCIEIKSTPDDRSSGHIQKLTNKVTELIQQPENQPYHHHILILSFDPMVLTQAHQSNAALRYVLNISKTTPDDIDTHTGHLWGLGVDIAKISKKSMEWAHHRNLRVLTYTCNGPRQISKALKLGVDAIITDRPQWLCRRLGRDNIPRRD